MKRIDPNSPAYKALLLESAINILKGSNMSKHARHDKLTHNAGAAETPKAPWPFENMTKPKRGKKAEPEAQAAEPAPNGDGQATEPVVQSGFSIFNQQPQGATMSEDKTPEKAKAPKLSKEDREAMAKAKAAEREAKKAAAEAERAAKAAEREAKRLEKQAEREKALIEAREKGLKYTGTMLALRDAKTKYVKSSTGRLRSTDPVAEALDTVSPNDVITLVKIALKLESNPYSHLNVGQQSMNLRNKLRVAIRKGELSVADIEKIRDDNNLGMSAEEQAARAEKAAKAAERQAKREAALAEQAAKAAEQAETAEA